MSLRISFLLALLALGRLAWAPPPESAGPRFRSSVPTGASLAFAARAGAGQDESPAVYVRARNIAEQLRTGVEESQREVLEQQLRTAVAALALRADRGSLPWRAWIEEHLNRLPLLAGELFRAALTVPETDRLALAVHFDRWGAPDDVRLEIQRLLWRMDPALARKSAREILDPRSFRANDLLQARLAEEVLRACPDPAAGELLRAMAVNPRMTELARRRAIAALVERRDRPAAPLLQPIFDTETNNLYLRQEALKALLILDPPRGKQLLLDLQVRPEVEPVLYEFVRRLRREVGLADVAPDPRAGGAR